MPDVRLRGAAGETQAKGRKLNPVVLGWLVICGAPFLLIGGNALFEELFPKEQSKSYFEEQYETSRKNSNITEMCIYAGMAADHFRRDGKLEQYQLWRATEVEDCYNARPIK